MMFVSIPDVSAAFSTAAAALMTPPSGEIGSPSAFVAVDVRMFITSSDVKSGFTESIKATTDDTNGVAMDVPTLPS